MKKFAKIFSFALCFVVISVSLSTSVLAEEKSGGTLVEESKVSIYASQKVGGGTWEYDTKIEGFWNKIKTVWSNYWHPTLTHGSSAQLGANTPNRSCVPKDLQSKASQSSSNTGLTGYAYWNITCTLVQLPTIDESNK